MNVPKSVLTFMLYCSENILGTKCFFLIDKGKKLVISNMQVRFKHFEQITLARNAVKLTTTSPVSAYTAC